MFGDEGFDEYRKAQVEARAASSSPEKLIVMLFEGFIDEIARLEGHLEAYNDPESKHDIRSKAIEKKGASIDKCLGILRGLDTALDPESGGDLAGRLHAHYEFMGKQLFVVTKSNDVSDLVPIKETISNLYEGWVGMSA